MTVLTEPEIREAAAIWQLGPAVAAETISVAGNEGPSDLRAGPDGRMWLTLDKGIAAVTAAGAVSRVAPPAGDRFDSFGFLGTGLLLCYQRAAHKVEFRDLAGQPDGRSFALTGKMKFPRFQPGPQGSEWISSIRAARVVWVRSDGSRGWAEEFGSAGYALTEDGLMWGLSDGFFALDADGALRHRLYFSGEGVPHATDDGALWFDDGPGPGDDGSVPYRINRYDRGANLLERWTLPLGWSLFELCPMPGGKVAFVASDGGSSYVGVFTRNGAGSPRKVAGARLLVSLAPDAQGKVWCADLEGKSLFVTTL